MSRIRVVHVIARLNVGGPARILDELAIHMDPQEFELILLVGSVPPGEAQYEALSDRIQTHAIRALGPGPRASADLKALAEVTRTLRKLRPDIVHTHTAKAGVLGRLGAGWAGVHGRAHTYHGHLLRGYFRPRTLELIIRVERFLASRTTRLIGVGESVRDELLAARVGRPEQWRVVRPGVSAPAPLSRAEARRTLGIADDAQVVGYVGRLVPIKRPDRLAEAFLEVAATHPRAVLVVAGDGPLGRGFRERLAGLGDRVRHLGWRQDPETIYAASDVVVLTSDNEGTPMSLIEAAWCGRAAVATNVGGVDEVVRPGQTGLVVEPNSSAVAAGLRRLLVDLLEQERMGREARAVAAQEFAAARMATATAALYREILTSARTGR